MAKKMPVPAVTITPRRLFRAMRMLPLLLSALVSGCAGGVLEKYEPQYVIEPEPEQINPDENQIPAIPFLKGQFFRNGKHYPSNDQALMQSVARSLAEIGVASSRKNCSLILEVTVDDIYDEAIAKAAGQALGRKLLEGQADGAATAVDNYRFSFRFLAGEQSLAQSDYASSIVTHIGHDLPPNPKAFDTSDAPLEKLLRNFSLRFLKDAQDLKTVWPESCGPKAS